MLIRLNAWLAMAIFLSSCTGNNNPDTFQGEPLVAGSDHNTVVRTIDDTDYPSVLLIAEKGDVGIGVFQPQTGSPVLTLRDNDNDGVFDLLTYSALSDSGEALVDVEDYGMDGQPDLILDHEARSAKVFVNDSWHDVDGVGTQNMTVEIEGERHSLNVVLNALGRPN